MDYLKLAVDMAKMQARERRLVSGQEKKSERPDDQWVLGRCPHCLEVTVTNYYHQGGKGYIGFEECWNSLGEMPTCSFRKVL